MTELVKQIPDMLTGNDLEEALWVRPNYDSSIRKAGVAERLLALENIYKLYIPSNLSKEVYNKIYLSVIRGLKDKDSIAAVRQRNQNFRMIKRQEHQGVISGTDSFTIIGASGIGKSSAIARAITVAVGDKVMTMTETGCKIIPCLQIQCPFDCSTKSMLYDILRKIDEVIGSNYYEKALRARATVDILIGSVSTALLNHVCVLIIDEIQNIVNHRAGNSLVGALTQLINYSGITIAMVGIPESEAFFQKTDYLARRAIGLHFEKLEYGMEFINFCKVSYQYIYTRSAEVFSESVSLWLYEHSGGCLAIVVALFHDAQEIAILSGSDNLTIATLEEAYRKRYAVVYKNRVKMKMNGKKKEGQVFTPITASDEAGRSILYAEVIRKAVAEGMDYITALRCHYKVLEVIL